MDNKKEKTHYEILSVSESASQEEIKKSYRTLALKHHPDKGGDVDVFHKIGEAHEILSDPGKRKQYDLSLKGIPGGLGGLSHGFGSGGIRFSTGPMGPMGNMGNMGPMGDILSSIFGQASEKPTKTPDIKHTMNLSLDDMYKGKTCKIAISRLIICKACVGEGGSSKSTIDCTGCGGRGMRVMYKNNTARQTQCIRCKGEGKTTVFEKICKPCTSKGAIKERRVVEVVFKPGYAPGSKVVLCGMSDYGKGLDCGDVIITATQKPHDVFTRFGSNIKHTMCISLKESLCGLDRNVVHLDGRKIAVKSDKVLENGHKLIFPGEGIPNGQGKLEITIDVKYPKNVSDKVKSILLEHLPNME